jgi:hypothetical protein
MSHFFVPNLKVFGKRYVLYITSVS